MTTKKLLIETLNQLSPEDFAEFKSIIEVDKKFTFFSKRELKAGNTQDVVELMEETYGRGCVEETRKALMKMSRTDLVQRLSDKQFPALSQRVETMESLIELLLETLAHLSDSEFEDLKEILRSNHDFFQPRETEESDLQDTVFSMVPTYGQQSLTMIMEVLQDIRRSDLAQRMSDCSSEPKRKHLDEHLSAVIHKVATMAAVKELLLETLKDLSEQELKDFRRFLKFTCFKMDLPQIQTYINIAEELVDQMMYKLGHQSVEVIMEVLTDMKRTDLVQRLSESSSGLKAAGTSAEGFDVEDTEREKHSEDERWPALIHQVETMESVIELLLETLAALNDQELREFKEVREKTLVLRFDYDSYVTGILHMMADLQDTVFVMVQAYGQQSVKKTMERLKEMKRTDLAQRLSDCSSLPRKKHSVDDRRSALIHTMATMAAVKHLLLGTLNDLSNEEFKKFQRFLQTIFPQKNMLYSSWRLESSSVRAQFVDLMVNELGQQSVEATRKVFLYMKRTDLIQKLSESSSGSRDKLSVDEDEAALWKREESDKKLLLETLKKLSEQELKDFRWFLKFTCFKMDLPQIKTFRNKAEELVDQIMFKLGHQSVEVIMEVLTDMKRTDLVQRLSESSSGLKAAGTSAEGFDVEDTEREKHSEDERWPALIHQVETMESVIELLLETLAALNDQELREFTQVLFEIHHHRNKYDSGFPLMLYMMADLQDTVFVMVQTYGQQSVEKTMEVLKEMKRTDLAQRLSDCSSLPRKKHSVDDRHSALIHTVATMAAVKHLLLGTLNDLSKEEFKKFQRFLQMIFPQKNLSYSSWRFESSSVRAEFVDLMVDELGQRSVEATRKVFVYMKRTDLIQKLSESSSGSREKLSVDEDEAALLKREEELEAVRQILFETLKDLRFEDLKKFSLFLKLTCFKMGLPRIQTYRNTAEELVNQMVDELGHQSVEVIMEVLTDLKRTDLVQRLSESSSGLKGRETGGSSESEDCGSVMQNSSDWTKLEPEVNGTDADEAPTYSLQSEAGHFECSVSGLRWVCKVKASFQYQFGSWEGHMERMESRGYIPAGPLMDVTVTAGKLNEVHLPHWICTDDIPDILDKFAVLHIDDCGDVVEKVSEVTPSHVKLMEPNFSLIGALISFFFPLKISCFMLMYYKPNTSFLKLHVYPIRQDPALEQRINKDETSDGYKRLKKPHPDRYLQTERAFSLRADMETAEIQPEELTFRYNSLNFYEVYIKDPEEELNLTLIDSNDGEPEHEPVWKCKIHENDYSASGRVEEKHSVDEHLSVQMQTALTIQSDREKLLGMLEDLTQNELENFKWFLGSSDAVMGLPRIPKSRLEKATTCDLVDLMLQTYTEKSVEVTKNIFQKIKRNDLVQRLSESSSGLKS
ncbi:uncharacterized protein LOC115794827 isoform X2 [Archocentrus centrarchus]|uniref:uncharacterized protein LOC115794827 isoform X2 n=1 Tax=Archocentrus centrarchus TaxID=63155 RepID=UPI0011E9D307|nr:uncharacterized protein LOC115794827 isoform X2 [Archocentrus centrarchus]